jgi:serine O-acetyltransferase
LSDTPITANAAPKKKRNHKRTRLHNAFTALSALRLLPHIVLFYVSPERETILADVKRWGQVFGFEPDESHLWQFLWLFAMYPEFRNLFYYRVKRAGRLFYFLAPPMDTLFLPAHSIGPGLFLQHGFASVLLAKRIGANCWINQQVTIGSDHRAGAPVLEDNVVVNAGAKIIGNVTIGTNSVVGANAVVVKNVPPNCTVVGVPARIVRRDGKRVDEAL